MFVYTRREAAKLSTPAGESARRDERAAELGRRLVADFKERLIEGQLIAAGFSKLAIDPMRIPGERWRHLWPNFIENKGAGADLEFTDIRITEPTGHEAQIECVEWLRERKEQGESRKKEVLREEARRRFGAALILLPRLHAKSGTMGRLPQ
jgi:hypothetical protein